MNRKEIIEDMMQNFGAMRRKIMTESHEHLHQSPITPSQAQVLHIIKHHGSVGIKEIASILGTTSSAATQLVDGLVNNGFITREESPTDRRALIIKLSETSKKRFETMRSKSLEKISRVFEVLSDSELQTLHDLHKKITDNITAEKEI